MNETSKERLRSRSKSVNEFEKRKIYNIIGIWNHVCFKQEPINTQDKFSEIIEKKLCLFQAETIAFYNIINRGHLSWVPDHRNIKVNEMADCQARKLGRLNGMMVKQIYYLLRKSIIMDLQFQKSALFSDLQENNWKRSFSR